MKAIWELVLLKSIANEVVSPSGLIIESAEQNADKDYGKAKVISVWKKVSDELKPWDEVLYTKQFAITLSDDNVVIPANSILVVL